MGLGIGKRKRRRLSMGDQNGRILVRVCALALVALLLGCEASNAQQQEREPALNVDALEEDIVTDDAVVPEIAPVEDVTRSTDSHRVEGWKDRKAPSVSHPQGQRDTVSMPSDVAASALATGDKLREIGVHHPHEAIASAAAAGPSTPASSDTEGVYGGVGGDDGGAADNSDNDDAEDDGAGASRSGDRRSGVLHPNSEQDSTSPPAEEDGLHVSAAARDQGTTMVDAEARVVANVDEKSEEEKESEHEEEGERGGLGVEGDKHQHQEKETEEQLNAAEIMNGTVTSLTDAGPKEAEACCGDADTAAAADDDDDPVEASNEDEGTGGGTDNAAPNIEPSDSAVDSAPTSGSSGGVDPVGGGGGGASDTGAATATAATTGQQPPISEPENGSNVDEAAAASHTVESTATAGILVEEAESTSGDDAVTGYGPADGRSDRPPAKTPSNSLPDTETLADDVRVFAGHEEPPGMDEGVRVESAGREGSTLDGGNDRAEGERYQRRDSDGQRLAARLGAQKNDREKTSSGGGAAGGDAADIEFARGSQEELAQRVRQMEAEVLRKILAEEDAKSLLDIWVERAREYVLTRTVPPTDAECDFNWSRLRCEPKCLCGARLRFGDYTPGRTCRLLHHWERSPECEAAWDPSDEPAVRRLASTLAWALGSAKRAYEARVAPPSDPECVFDLETRRCQPQSLCRLKFRWGDLTPSGACRLAQEEKPAASGGSGSIPLH